MSTSNESLRTSGAVLSNARWYDLLVWLLTRGKERAFRERLISLAACKSGESVLDVGCGTGTLAIAAKRFVGTGGTVVGVDASPEMIAKARSKAQRAGAQVRFENALAEALPFSPAEFNVVLSTLMLHHLPQKTRTQCLSEIRRVLKPDGRVLFVDFERSAGRQRGVLGRLHRRRHGHVSASELRDAVVGMGLKIIDSGPLGIEDLHFTLARGPTFAAGNSPERATGRPKTKG